MPIERRTVAPAPSDCSRARKEPLISRDVGMVVMCLVFVGWIVVLMLCVNCLNMALDARLLLYAMRSAATIAKREKSNFIERKNSFIDLEPALRSGWKIQISM